MRRFLLTLVFVAATVPAAAEVRAAAGPEAEILAVLQAAESGWNAGDLETYMQAYWKSDDLRFAGGDRVSYGWETTLANYRKSYPDRKTMGRLTFADLDIRVLAPDAALVFGSWRLDREGEDPGQAPHGLYTLLLCRLPAGWRIVHDHTSAAE